MERLIRFFAFVGISAVALFGCTSYDYSSISLSQSAIYMANAGDVGTITFTTYNVKSIEVNSYPEGWDVAVSLSRQTITITAPDSFDDDGENEESGRISITGYGKDDNSTTIYITVGMAVQTADLSALQSNCFVVQDAGAIYSFDATVIGETEQTISPASADIVWQSSPSPLAYASLQGDNVEFYVSADTSDVDGDGSKTDIIEGNALIAVYDASGVILWSWHIWVTESGYEELAQGDIVLMDRNLGAFTNDNSSQSEILRSYGLYYQWGRKEPFIQPSTYNASGGTSATMLSGAKTAVTISAVSSSSDVGTSQYALENPLHFILGVGSSSYDWLYSAHDTSRWSSSKTINDPCPKGWRVADADAFANLTIADGNDLEALRLSYGWMLTDGATESLYMGLGRRNYLNGAIQNVNTNTTPEPWVGNYWTIGTGADNYSLSLYFEYDNVDSANNSINSALLAPRANGMQLRCQKI